MTRLLILAVTAASITTGAPSPASAQTPNPDYFPHSDGSQWVYRRTFGADIKTLYLQVGENVQGDSLTIVKFTGDGEYLGFEDQMEISADAINYPAAEVPTDKPVVLLPRILKAGQEWDSLLPAGCGYSQARAIVNGPEEVTVPAGKFKAIKVTYAGQILNNKTSMLVWYVDGIGVVKQVFSPTASNIIIELTKYIPAK